jgi:hypothetical protein
MLTVKNSTKRQAARFPAPAMSAGSAGPAVFRMGTRDPYAIIVRIPCSMLPPRRVSPAVNAGAGGVKRIVPHNPLYVRLSETHSLARSRDRIRELLRICAVIPLVLTYVNFPFLRCPPNGLRKVPDGHPAKRERERFFGLWA